MLYQNVKTGNTVFPQLRPGPEVQQKDILNTFWSFFSEASEALNHPGVYEYSVGRDIYRFFARSEGIHKLYLLLSADCGPCDIVAQDILKSLKAF